MAHKTKKTNSLIFWLAMAAAAFMAVSFFGAAVSARTKTYTTDADFEEGVLVGVEHETVHDQLQLSQIPVTLPFIWVPNNNGTVSKVCTETGDELGRYRVVPPGLDGNGSPSRTTVDLDGSCWVGNRRAGTVVKIGLYEAGQWIDRNESSDCNTSQDRNPDGNIDENDPTEFLPWGEDECVLYEVVLIPGVQERTWEPNTYPGEYDTRMWGTSPRGLAIDANNNLWAGRCKPGTYFYIDGSNGQILREVDVSSEDHQPYGAVIDSNGILWSSTRNRYHVLRLDPADDSFSLIEMGDSNDVYGLGLDYLDHLFVTGWNNGNLYRINVTTGDIEWTQARPEGKNSRGVAATSDNNIWVANSGNHTVTRYDNEGILLATIPLPNDPTPTGVAVDAAGKVWVCDLEDEYIHRINPATNTIDLSKQIIGSGGHYSYSDMTGIVSRTITTKTGTWTVIYDSETENMHWGLCTISWNMLISPGGEGSGEPDGTEIIVEVQASNDKDNNWPPGWQRASKGRYLDLTSTSRGRYLKIRTTLKIISGDVSLILYYLTVKCLELGCAFRGEPKHMSAGVPLDAVLSLSPGEWAANVNGHDVYFGTDFDDVNDATIAEPLGVYMGRQDANTFDTNSYDPNGLELNTTYYWRIDEVNDACAPYLWKGAVWSFTTVDHLIVDNFESYTNDANLAATWVAGGSALVGLSTNRRHGGKQSMMVDYYNAIGPYYADVNCPYGTGQDWTAHSVKSLDLWFYGDPYNDAEQMYVALEDTSSNSAVVIHDDPNALKNAGWQVWRIALQDFKDIGVNLANVKKITIGIGDGVDPWPDYAMGAVYIDDIRLYPTRCVPEYAIASLNNDCVTNLEDVKIMADEWLTSGTKADLVKDNNVDFKDYAILANNWLKEVLWP